jgi:hypothetical protein
VTSHAALRARHKGESILAHGLNIDHRNWRRGDTLGGRATAVRAIALGSLLRRLACCGEHRDRRPEPERAFVRIARIPTSRRASFGLLSAT